MLVITGFFNGEDRFIPDNPIKIPQNTKVKITIDERGEELLQRQAVLIEDITKELQKIEDEDLPEDFTELFGWHSSSGEIAL